MDKRKDWDHYFMDIAQVVAERANCSRRQIGSVIVCDKRIISTGYNGTPKGIQNCFDGGCKRCEQTTDKTSGTNLDYCICSHAEENAIVQAAKNGVSTENCTIYTTHLPCTGCAKMIINSGIVRCVASLDYPSDLTTNMLKEAGIILDKIS